MVFEEKCSTFVAKNTGLTLFDGTFGAKNIGLTLFASTFGARGLKEFFENLFSCEIFLGSSQPLADRTTRKPQNKKDIQKNSS